MIALPKARSQGSNGAGGGALSAFTAISAAKLEPAVIASTAATKTIFFMTIPTTFQKSVRFRRPPGTSDNRLQRNSLTCPQSGTSHRFREAKKTSICRLFRRYGHSWKCCRRVLHSNNNFEGLQRRLGDLWVPLGEDRMRGRPNQTDLAEPGGLQRKKAAAAGAAALKKGDSPRNPQK